MNTVCHGTAFYAWLNKQTLLFCPSLDSIRMLKNQDQHQAAGEVRPLCCRLICSQNSGVFLYSIHVNLLLLISPWFRDPPLFTQHAAACSATGIFHRCAIQTNASSSHWVAKLH